MQLIKNVEVTVKIDDAIKKIATPEVSDINQFLISFLNYTKDFSKKGFNYKYQQTNLTYIKSVCEKFDKDKLHLILISGSIQIDINQVIPFLKIGISSSESNIEKIMSQIHAKGPIPLFVQEYDEVAIYPGTNDGNPCVFYQIDTYNENIRKITQELLKIINVHFKQ